MKSTPIVAAFAGLISAVASAETLRITISGLEAGKGNLRLAVFDESRADQWLLPDATYLYALDLPAGAGEMTYAIAGVKPGKYAISAFQDANQNQQLDRDADNIPTESYGFSTYTGNRESTFEEALFDTELTGYDVSIELRSADRSAPQE